MKISSELKTELLKANSEEEVKALLGDQATEEEASHVWQEIERCRPAEGLEAVDDDELDAVSGGADRDFLTQGCSATVEYGSHCWSDDSCSIWDVTYDNEEYACTIGYKNHDWGPVKMSYWREGNSGSTADISYYRICKRCGKKAACKANGTIK